MFLFGGKITVWPEWVINMDYPPCTRAYYVHSGWARYTDGDTDCVLQPGKLYLLPSTTKYSMTTDPGNPMRQTYLHFDISPAEITRLTEIDLEENSFVRPLLEAIGGAYDEHKKSLVPALAETLEQYWRDTGVLTQPKEYVVTVHDYIDHHYREALTVEQLSRLCGYNPQYFIRLFKNDMGLTPHQYVLNCRLREAIRLLSGEESIQEIAERVGFRDYKTFGRAFRRQFGYSPGRFRRQMLRMI